MRWILKAAVQGTISLVPRGPELNYFLQKNVSRRLPRPAADFDFHAATAATHLAGLERVRTGVDRSTLRCYEFGAGWDLIGPIAMWALGIDHQTIVDIRPNVRIELVNHTIREFALNSPRLERALGSRLRAVDGTPITSTGDLVSRFGITYLAPQDARAVPLDGAVIDFVTSTFTLQHIPADEIAAILRETRRLMTPDAIISSLIDMKDHYRYVDDKVSPYNFLRYPSWAWRFLNPSLQWQSRLRHSQYLELFTRAGYDIVLDEPATPSDSELDQLKHMRVAREFAHFPLVDLGTKSTHLLARPAES